MAKAHSFAVTGPSGQGSSAIASRLAGKLPPKTALHTALSEMAAGGTICAATLACQPGNRRRADGMTSPGLIA
jgi:hypothetical protein